MWFWFALASAFGGAISTSLRKITLGQIDASVLTWANFVFPIPLLAVMTLCSPIKVVPIQFWVAATASGIIFTFSDIITNRSLKNSRVSRIDPFSAVGVLFIYLLSLIFLDERISGVAVGGLVLIIIGSYTLNVSRGNKGILQPVKSLAKDRLVLLYIPLFL